MMVMGEIVRSSWRKTKGEEEGRGGKRKKNEPGHPHSNQIPNI